MASSKDALARAHNKDLKHKHEMKALEGALLRKALVTLSAGVYGAMTRYGISPSMKGFPWKLGVWVISTVAEASTRGMLQQVAGGLADTTLAIYTHDAIAKNSLVAGDGGEL
jgi:hypothetical protein